MKTSTRLRNCLVFGSAVALGVLTTATAAAQSQTNKLRVGVYDSRAVAIAYGNSPEFRETLKPVQADYQKAKEEKNEKRMKEIDARMKLQQRRMHEQGFSTGSVAGIMARVKDSLPDVAKKAGVQIVVSKWELNHHSSEVEMVDVTNEIVALFHPGERVLTMLKGLPSHAPLPIEEITDDMD